MGDSLQCWEYMNCGREERGTNGDKIGACPAFPNQGRNCWNIAGTYCGEKVKGSIACIIDDCDKCSWHAYLNKNEF